MSENKFLARLKGEPTPKSVVEIQNDRLVAPFKSSPMGHIADRDSSIVVAKGAQNWAVNQDQLVPVADDYIGTESDLSGTSRVSGAGLWLNATYTFPATVDETNPVSAIIAPSAKWVLTLCGDSLITQNGNVITLTMLVKIGATHLTTKQFKIRECASQFSQRMAIDFSESEQKVIKAHGGSPLTVQVLCDDESASATIYSGMTHLTLLQRKIDADLVATDNVLLPEFIENLLKGYIIPEDYFSRYEYLEQVEEGNTAFPEFTREGDKMIFTGWGQGGQDITAEDVAYTNEQYPDMENLQDAMDELLYTAPNVSISGGGSYEIGYKKETTNLSWTWSKKITSQSLNQGIGQLDPTVRSYTYDKPITSNTTFTITGTDGKTTKTASTSVTFQPSRYWGVSAKTSLTDADILGLSSELSTSRTQSRTFNCSGGKYFYFVIRTDYCSGIKFKVGGLSFSDMIVETRSVVNAQGYSQSYNIYRVNNIQTGSAIAVEVL